MITRNQKTNKKPVLKYSTENGQVGTPRCERILEWRGWGGQVRQRCRKKAVDAGLCKSCAQENA